MQKKLEDSSVEVTLRYRSLLQTESIIHLFPFNFSPVTICLGRGREPRRYSTNRSRWSSFLPTAKRIWWQRKNCLQCLPLAAVSHVLVQGFSARDWGGVWSSCFRASQRSLSIFVNSTCSERFIVSASGCCSWTYPTKRFGRGSVQRFLLTNEL